MKPAKSYNKIGRETRSNILVRTRGKTQAKRCARFVRIRVVYVHIFTIVVVVVVTILSRRGPVQHQGRIRPQIIRRSAAGPETAQP